VLHTSDGRERLRIYLNDHLAGATVGVELARRTLSNNRGTPLGDDLAGLLGELRTDRQALEALMAELGLAQAPIKRTAGYLAEKVGRLKLNGQLRGYSPLSRLVELEGLALGVEGKRRLWWTAELLGIAEFGGYRPGTLLERAERQLELLDRHRQEAAAEAFAGVGALG
jgi:hypothetical protein